MQQDRVRFSARPLAALALTLFSLVAPSGCGEEQKTGGVPVIDTQAEQQRNKDMENYMKSKAGKAAQKPK